MIWGVLHGGVTENPSYDYLDQMYSTFVVPLNAKTIILITQSTLDLIFTCPINKHDFDYKLVLQIPSGSKEFQIEFEIGADKIFKIQHKSTISVPLTP